MIGALKPYPEMKDSGVQWMGDVPGHWGLEPIARLGRLFKGRGGSKEDEVADGVPCVRYGDLYSRYDFVIRDTKAHVTPERAAAYTPIQYGDVLFAASGETIDDIGRSAVNLMEAEACCGGDILVFRAHADMVAPFLGYAAGSTASRHQKACMGRGFTVVHIYGNELKRLALPVPPLPEQTAIVRFLDYVDRRIRRYIRAKQKLIKLLEEERQAIIHRVVTRGLDPDMRLKDSGVEWLGKVPEHWDVVRNGRLFTQRNETGFAELPILEVSLRTGVRVRDLSNPNRKQVMTDRDQYKRACANDIAYNMMRMWQGAVGVVPVEGLVSPAYVVARPLPGTESRYFANLFRTAAYMTQVDKYSRGIVKDRNRLYWLDFKAMPSCCPPLDEQVGIADWIDEQSGRIDHGLYNVREEISLLRELRTRLIADVVTGKLDVRDVAARLPDDDESVAEDDVLDEDAPILEDPDLDAELEEMEV